MKNFVLGMIATLSLVAASQSFAAANDKDAAASIIEQNYRNGNISEMQANEAFTRVFAPGEVAQFAGYLLGKLYQGGKWLVVNGVQTSVSTALCIVDSAYESGALTTCGVVSTTQGADALHACWDKAFTSSAWQKNCVGKEAAAPQAAPLQ